MATQYGLTTLGFVVKQQQQIIAEINSSLQQSFGANVNIGPESLFGQIVGIFSEREALLWQLGDAINASQYPAGAEGTSVDNILALNNLKRLGAQPTVTNPAPLTQSNGITLYGLVLLGTAGTTIPKNSIIQNGASPALSFTLDSAVQIAAAINAVQSIFFGNVPDTGAFELSIEDANEETLTTPSIPYTSLAAQTLLNISTTPGATSGFTLSLSQGGIVQTTGTISTNSAYPTSGAIQTAIRALTGYSAVTVSGSAGAYIISWGSISNPLTTIATNTTGATITPTDSVQATINNLKDSTSITIVATTTNGSSTVSNLIVTGLYTGMAVTGTGIAANSYITAIGTDSVTLNNNATASGSVNLTFEDFYPYTDVLVTGSFAAGSFVVTFGSGTIINYNPVSSYQPQATMSVTANTLELSATVTNINIVQTAIGAPAQAIGTATCTVNGANFVGAGTLTVIGSPTSGWSGVTNQLDCITGSIVETDTEALTRRSTLLAAQANGPIQAIVEKVLEVTGVSAAIGFSNLTGAAQQIITFDSIPSSGHWGYSLVGQTTANLAYNALASDVQTALQALTGYERTLVTGNIQYGFVIDFNGSYGGQAIPLGSIVNNTTGVTADVNFGRPPKSFEIVAEGGADTDIAKVIYQAMPAGILSYSSPTAITTGSASSGSPTLSVSSTSGIEVGDAIFGAGVAQAATVVSIGVGSVVMSLPAIGNSSSAKMIFNHTVEIEDQFGNPTQIAFSRPTQIPIYVALTLVTDIYNTPGDSGSGLNPNSKFQVGSINDIQNDLVNIGAQVSIGGLVIGFGSNGLIGAFNNIPGIVEYTLYFGLSASPSTNTNIQMQVEQQALFESFNVVVSYS